MKLTWNNFDLYVFLQGESGRNGFYNGLGVWENVSQGVYMTHHRQSWTPERYAAGEAITYPALTSTTSSSLAANDFFTSKADFFRLKNVTLGYSIEPTDQVDEENRHEPNQVLFYGSEPAYGYESEIQRYRPGTQQHRQFRVPLV